MVWIGSVNTVIGAEGAEAAIDAENDFTYVKQLKSHYLSLPAEEIAALNRKNETHEEWSIPSSFCEFTNKKILDVCSALGISSRLMAAKNSVTAVEPDWTTASYGAFYGNYDKVDIHPIPLQELPHQYDDFFDIATIIWFLVPFNERALFFKRLSEVLKPEGKAYIVFAWSVGEYSSEYYYFNHNNALHQVIEPYFHTSLEIVGCPGYPDLICLCLTK